VKGFKNGIISRLKGSIPEIAYMPASAFYQKYRHDVRFDGSLRSLLIFKLLKLQYLLSIIGSQNIAFCLNYLKGKKPSSFITRAKQSEEYKQMINLLSNIDDTEDLKIKKIYEILETTKDLKKCLIYARYREVAKVIYKNLSSKYENCSLLMGQGGKDHEGVTTTRKSQNLVLDNFIEPKQSIQILVSTTVSEQGLDIPGVQLVICYQPPKTVLKYIQRRGRTGRNNQIGKVIYLIAKDTTDQNLIQRILW